ncbi:M50 family metallopeptidase [Flavobacterium sedimenticola]|uniref:M50 family metallopeptidase n=1 Tax=Flavobacterium sedimenticola TaxID=3043286 RepID=A0ABT6XTM3_9FLAO|nr:M50 family metallopeptidase [Flavobacterium sedimenticola]MDI9257959.1 M50 family metallopeptidase [Flavobacterium sedimenticola]
MTIKKDIFLKAIKSIAFIIVFGGIGFFAGKMGIAASSGMSKLTFITLLLLFVPIFLVVIAIHEAGHALAGVWMKFNFKIYIVGPFMWEKNNNKWRFKWNKNVNTAGGLVICMPVGTENIAKRFSVYAAGGPIASLTLSLLSYVLYYSLPTHIESQLITNSLLIMAVLSLIIFISTAIPLRANGFSSDGARVLRILKGGDTARFELLILKLITNAYAGIRPSEIDQNELNEALSLAKKLKAPFGVYLHSFLHQSELDRGNIDSAEQHLLNYIKEVDSIPKGIRNIVWLDAAFFYAFAKKDITQATNYWNNFEPAALIPKAQIRATKAAMNVLKNESELALSNLESAEKEIVNMLDRGLSIALQERISVLKKDINV